MGKTRGKVVKREKIDRPPKPAKPNGKRPRSDGPQSDGPQSSKPAKTTAKRPRSGGPKSPKAAKTTKVSVPPTKLHCASYEDLFTEEDDVANNSDDQVMVHATESLEQENRSLQKKLESSQKVVEQLQTKLVEQQGNLEKALKKNQSLGRKIKHLEEVAAQLKMDNEEYKQYNSIANEEVEKLKEQLLVLENLGKSGVRLSLDQINGGGKRIIAPSAHLMAWRLAKEFEGGRFKQVKRNKALQHFKGLTVVTYENEVGFDLRSESPFIIPPKWAEGVKCFAKSIINKLLKSPTTTPDESVKEHLETPYRRYLLQVQFTVRLLVQLFASGYSIQMYHNGWKAHTPKEAESMTAEEIMKQQPVVLQGSYELASTALRLAQSMRRLEEKGVAKEDTEADMRALVLLIIEGLGGDFGGLKIAGAVFEYDDDLIPQPPDEEVVLDSHLDDTPMRHRGAACAEETPESVGYPGAKATFDQYPPSGIMTNRGVPSQGQVAVKVPRITPATIKQDATLLAEVKALRAACECIAADPTQKETTYGVQGWTKKQIEELLGKYHTSVITATLKKAGLPVDFNFS